MRERYCDKLGLYDLISSLNRNHITMVEIGSFAGESAEIFLKTGKVDRIICIDPWMTIAGNDGNAYSNMDVIERKFDVHMNQYGEQCIKFRGTLDTFISTNLYTLVKPDFVYIDALHTYDACKSDINNTLKF